jgi:hypothetical protein
MTNRHDNEPVKIGIQKSEDPKAIGGGNLDAWNDRLMLRVLNALPVDRADKLEIGKAGTAVFSGMVDIKSADPIEGMLVSQLVLAHEWAMMMFQKAWSQPSEYFDARCRYLALADKAQRTVVMLTERLDRHRGRGQQQITVRHQHLTVNADHAIVGNVEHHPGVGPEPKSKDQPHALGYAPGQTLRSADETREPLPIPSDEKRTVPDARRSVPRCPEGK